VFTLLILSLYMQYWKDTTWRMFTQYNANRFSFLTNNTNSILTILITNLLTLGIIRTVDIFTFITINLFFSYLYSFIVLCFFFFYEIYLSLYTWFIYHHSFYSYPHSSIHCLNNIMETLFLKKNIFLYHLPRKVLSLKSKSRKREFWWSFYPLGAEL